MSWSYSLHHQNIIDSSTGCSSRALHSVSADNRLFGLPRPLGKAVDRINMLAEPVECWVHCINDNCNSDCIVPVSYHPAPLDPNNLALI